MKRDDPSKPTRRKRTTRPTEPPPEQVPAEAAPADGTGPEATCATCLRPTEICVCDRVSQVVTKRRVLILQHPQEQDVTLGTAGLVVQCLPRACLRVGLSWASLAQALGEQRAPDPKRWAVIYPGAKKPSGKNASAKNPSAKSPSATKIIADALTDRQGKPAAFSGIAGFVVLDGSWSQAKALWWRNPWLLKLNRLSLVPHEPSIYGSLRREPRKGYVSTLEAVAHALTAAGEDEQARTTLLRLFRTMAQRAREARERGLSV